MRILLWFISLLVLTKTGLSQSVLDDIHETATIIDLSNKDINTNVTEYLDFRKFKDVIEINLSHNQFTTLPSDIFIDNSKLEKVSLSGNPLILDDEILESDSLEELDLSNCNIKDLPESMFIALPNLQVIDLSENPINMENFIAFRLMQKPPTRIILSALDEETMSKVCNEIDTVFEFVNENNKVVACEEVRLNKKIGLTDVDHDINKKPNEEEPKDKLKRMIEKVDDSEVLSGKNEIREDVMDTKRTHAEAEIASTDVENPKVENDPNVSIQTDANTNKLENLKQEEETLAEEPKKLSNAESGIDEEKKDDVGEEKDDDVPKILASSESDDTSKKNEEEITTSADTATEEEINTTEDESLSSITEQTVEENVEGLKDNSSSDVRVPADVTNLEESETNPDPVDENPDMDNKKDATEEKQTNNEESDTQRTAINEQEAKSVKIGEISDVVEVPETLNSEEKTDKEQSENDNKMNRMANNMQQDIPDIGEVKTDEEQDTGSWKNIIYLALGIGVVGLTIIGYVLYRRKNKYTTVEINEPKEVEMVEIKVEKPTENNLIVDKKPETKPLMYGNDEKESTPNNLPNTTVGTKPLMYGDPDIKDMDDDKSFKEDSHTENNKM